MRFIFFILLFFILTLTVKSQSWFPLNTPFPPSSIYVLETIDSNLYVGGSFTMNIGGVNTYEIAKWNGFKWDSLSIGCSVNPQWGSYSPQPVLAIKKFNGEIYAAGEFRYAGYLQSPQISKFNGTSWEAINTIYLSTLDKIRAMQIYNDKLIVVGSFDSLGNSNGSIYSDCCIAAWDSSGWSLFQGGDLNGSANSIVFNGELYVGGDFETAGGVSAYDIARWDGTQWKSCELGTTDAVACFAIDSVNGKLYVGGGFDYVVKSDSTGIYCNGIAVWDGIKWSALPEVLPMGLTNTLSIYHGKLYTGSGSTYLSAWNGKHWEQIAGLNNVVRELGIYKDTLFVAGFFSYFVDSNGDTIDAPNLVRYWTPDYCDSIHSFTLSTDTVYISDSTVVQFAPAGFANQYQWDFGASTSSDTAALQSHYFDSVGVNIVKLIATYGLCPWDTVIKTVTVIDDCQQTIITVPDTVVKNTVIQFTGNNPEATQWQWFIGSTLISDTTNAIYFFDSAGTYTITVITSYKNCHDTVTATVIVVNALGVEELAVGSRQLKIYPNPAGGSFTVEIQSSKVYTEQSRSVKGKSSKVEIYDAGGKQVYHSAINNHLKIETEGWKKGVYFVNLISEGKIITMEKIIIE